jgi:hypothetical protein
LQVSEALYGSGDAGTFIVNQLLSFEA